MIAVPYKGECYDEARQVEDGSWFLFQVPYKTCWKYSSLSEILREERGPDWWPLVVKTNSPDYRDYELVWTPQEGFLFDDDDFFRMQLDVSTEEFFK